jgi:hypothetical protein
MISPFCRSVWCHSLTKYSIFLQQQHFDAATKLDGIQSALLLILLPTIKMPNSNGNSMSQNEMVREAGFTSFNQFLNSYGLRLHNAEDVQEGKAILKGLFQDRQGSVGKADGAGSQANGSANTKGGN